jgi:hypothetical protein
MWSQIRLGKVVTNETEKYVTIALHSNRKFHVLQKSIGDLQMSLPGTYKQGQLEQSACQ